MQCAFWDVFAVYGDNDFLLVTVVFKNSMTYAFRINTKSCCLSNFISMLGDMLHLDMAFDLT